MWVEPPGGAVPPRSRSARPHRRRAAGWILWPESALDWQPAAGPGGRRVTFQQPPRSYTAEAATVLQAVRIFPAKLDNWFFPRTTCIAPPPWRRHPQPTHAWLPLTATERGCP